MKKIVYILSNFPHLTETFIAREIFEIYDNGQDVQVLSLRPKKYAHMAALKKKDLAVFYASSSLFMLVQALFSNLGKGKSILFSFETLADAFAILFKGKLKGFFKFLTVVLLAETVVYQFLKSRQKEEQLHLHTHFLFSASYITYRLHKLLGCSFSITLHTKYITFLQPYQVNKVLKAAKFINCISSELKGYIQSFGVDDLSNVHLIRNGINVGSLEFKPQYQFNTPLRILGIGSLLDKKGFDDLVRCCAELKKRDRAFHCNIIGEGPERPSLEALIAELGIADHVKLLGSKPFAEVKEFLRIADVLLMPSKVPKKSDPDGLPTVIIEAMTSGTPVVSTRFAGIPDIVINDQTGGLVDPSDYVGLAEAVIKMMDNEPLKNQMIDRGRQLVEEEYNLKKNIIRLQGLMNT